MASIYKYMSLNYLQDALDYGVYCSPITEVNDPYECEGIDNPEFYRIACMTNSSKKMLLWSYYINHRGCCVEFSIPKEFEKKIKKVKYDEDFVMRNELSIEQVIETLTHKGAEWSHENEYRAVYYSPDVNDDYIWIEKMNSGHIFLRLPVKAVCFGIYSHKEERYIESIKMILEYNKIHRSNVLIQKVKKSPIRYELVEDKQFNIKAELKKYSK